MNNLEIIETQNIIIKMQSEIINDLFLEIIFDIRQMLSYLGWLKSTDVYEMYVKYIKPFFEVRKAKKRISNYDRRKARYELEKSKQQQRPKTA